MGRLHSFPRDHCAAYFKLQQLWRVRRSWCEPPAPAPPRAARSASSGIIETARAKTPRFKDEHVTMAHGAGGEATQTLIEGLLVPGLRLATL